MNGLELAEAYFKQCGLPMLENNFAAYKQRIAAGLVGEGSECYGFDDQLSRDHDWGAAFCLWLEVEDYMAIGPELQQAYDALPQSFMGFAKRIDTSIVNGRIGVFSIPAFFQRLIGLDHLPATLKEWRLIPEYQLAAATNGQVFYDPCGNFTSFRQGLKAYYPEDIRLKKIAARCMTMAQAGQYNAARCLYHGEMLAARHALSIFIESAISMVFLLNKEFMPFYKWMHRAMKPLPILGAELSSLLEQLSGFACLSDKPMANQALYMVEEISALIIAELKRQGLSQSPSDFLFDHGPVVQMKIQAEWLRKMDVMRD